MGERKSLGFVPSEPLVKVGLIIYDTLETVSGGYLYDRMLVNALRSRNDRVDIISLPCRNYGRHLSDNFSASLLHRLRKASFDALLEDELNHPSLFLLNNKLQEQISCPIITIVHHLRCCETRPAWQNQFYRWIETRYLTTIDGFICNSRTTYSTVRTLVQEKRPHVIAYPGGDHVTCSLTSADIAERAEQDILRILFVGNVIPRKGLHTLIKALTYLASQSWRLTVVGSLTTDKTYVRKVRQQIKIAHLEDSVIFLGTVRNSELEAAFRRNHILAVPSSYEGFGIVYLEAMAFGLPVIASTSGAAPELIQDGREGFLVLPQDAASIAQCLSTLVTDRERLVQMSLAARERYLKHPSWDESMRDVHAFLHRLSDNNPGLTGQAR